jgi:hypothetical protein
VFKRHVVEPDEEPAHRSALVKTKEFFMAFREKPTKKPRRRPWLDRLQLEEATARN